MKPETKYRDEYNIGTYNQKGQVALKKKLVKLVDVLGIKKTLDF